MHAVITRRRSVAAQLAWTVGLLCVPTGLRLLLDHASLTGVSVPFVTYWPSLLAASLLLEVRYAVTFGIFGALLAQHLFGGGAWFGPITPQRIVYFLLFTFSSSLVVTTGALLRRTVRQLDAANAQLENFNGELRHRVRNMLTIIQSLASRGPKATNPLDFYLEFSSRLEGLARASDLLRIGADAEGRLPDLIEHTLQPFASATRINLRGQPCLIPDDSCIPLVMAMHELCTNAMKHGALSVETGHVAVSWFIAPVDDTLYVLWKETGGPRVSPPTREGTGTRLLRAQAGLDAVDLNFEPEGLWCEITIRGARPLGDRTDQARTY